MFDFGVHLKELRKSKNLTQKQLAAAIGASERGIQQYELGERKPTYDMLVTLANFFDVPMDELVGRDEPGNRSLHAGKLVARNLRRMRVELNLTQEQLAFQAGLTTAFISRLERGNANPTIGSLETISNALGIALADLIKEE